MITITAFSMAPDFAKGLVRDLRVRWALEEAGLPYHTRLITPEEYKKPAHYALHPFGQVPSYEEDGLSLFESGAIVLHIGEKSEALLPKEAKARARAMMWLFTALNTIEPAVNPLIDIDIFSADDEGAKARRAKVEEHLRKRLDDLAKALGGKDHFEGGFTAGDLVMATVLRVLRHTDLVTSHPVLGPYLARCEARPAFKRALADHMAAFRAA